MHKSKNTSPNFLHPQRSTYKKDKKPLVTFGAAIMSLVIALIAIGVIDHVKVSAQEHAQEQQNAQSEYITNNSNPVTERIYIKEVNTSPQFRYDENSVQIVDGYLSCVKDDHILQWQKGRERWECRKSTKVVFGELDKKGVVVSSAGTIQCKNNGEMLYWDTKKEYWSCGTVSAVIEADLDDSTDDGHNPAVNNVLTFDGSGWISETISDILGQEIIQYFTAINADVTDLRVTNVATLAQTDITGPLTVVGDTNITGETTITGNTNVTGVSTLSGPTFLNGTTTLVDATTGTLIVAGTSTLAQTDITGPLTVVGTTNMTGTTNVNGATTLSGPTALNGTTTAVNITTGTLTVTGTSTLAQTDITGPLTVVGATNMTGTTTLSGPTILNGTTTITSLAGVTSIDTTTENTIYNALDDDFFAQNGNSFGADAVLGTNDNNALAFETNGTEQMRINTNGNIGIGTTTSSEKLHVNGNMRVTGAFYDSSNSAGTNSYVLQTTGTGTQWVDTSTLGMVFENASGVVRNTGTNASDDFVFGSPQLADDGDANHDARMFFDKSKGAFRAGIATGTQWDNSNVGNYSIALGAGAIASGLNSVSIGRDTTASSPYATAFGHNTTASGSRSTAFGRNTTASGDYSMVFGSGTTARAGHEVVFGQYEESYTPNSTTGWDANDRLFVIANGAISSARSNAMTILKNGNVGIGTANPQASLHVNGHIWQTGLGRSVFIGENAGFSDDLNNNDNTFVGYASGEDNVDGEDNVALGAFTLRNNISGDANTTTGSGSMVWNTTGGYNDAYGKNALNSNLTGNHNVAIGSYALQDNTTGFQNTAVGHGALYYTETLRKSIISFIDMGSSVVRVTTSSSHNYSNGDVVVISGTENYNSGWQYGTTVSNVTSNTFDISHSWDGNDAIGLVQAHGHGKQNTALGWWAGFGSHFSDVTGSGNIFIGYQAGGNYETSSRNIIMGYHIDVPNTSLDNQMSIGNLIFGTGVDGTGTTLSSGNIGIGTISPTQKLDVNGSMTANRYYDRNNASYYVDPAGTSRLNTTYTHGAMYVGNSAIDSTDIYIADRLYDWDNTGYYLDPGSTSRLSRADITDLRADIFYDRNNTAYYVNPASTGTAAKFAGAVELAGSKIYESSNVLHFEAPYSFRFDSSNGMPTATLSVDGVASLYDDFGDGNLFLNGYAYGGRTGSVHFEGGSHQYNWIGQGITIGSMFNGQYSTGNNPHPNANLARVHIKGLTIDYDINPIVPQTCQAGWTNVGDVGGGSATDCQQIAGLIVENGRVGIGTKFPSYKLHVNGTAYAVGAAGALSDKRHKKDIITIGNGLDTILNLNPVSYEWIDPLDNGMQGTQFGFIAQEVENVMPSIVLTQDNEERTKGLKYTEFIPLTVRAIQEQNVLITKKATINSVKELQVDTGNKFVIASEMLNKIDADILDLYSVTNAQSTLISQIKKRMDVLELDMSMTDKMQTELKNMMIALDADKLVYTNNAGDLRLDGVLDASIIIADMVETSELNTDSVQVEVTGKAAIAGQGVIGADSTKEITIKTTAIQSDSMVLLTPQSPLTQSLAVSQINCDDDDNNCTGFKVELSETIDEPIGFNWFIVSAKKEDNK